MRVGIGLGMAVLLLLTPPVEMPDPDGLFWILLAVAVWETAGLWQTLLGLRKGWVATGVLALVGVVLALIGTVVGSPFWSAALQMFAYTWMAGVLGLQAVSFLVAGVISTPGCEWRAIPHLIAILRGRQVRFASCSLHLESLDRNEAPRDPA